MPLCTWLGGNQVPNSHSSKTYSLWCFFLSLMGLKLIWHGMKTSTPICSPHFVIKNSKKSRLNVDFLYILIFQIFYIMYKLRSKKDTIMKKIILFLSSGFFCLFFGRNFWDFEKLLYFSILKKKKKFQLSQIIGFWFVIGGEWGFCLFLNSQVTIKPKNKLVQGKKIT